MPRDRLARGQARPRLAARCRLRARGVRRQRRSARGRGEARVHRGSAGARSSTAAPMRRRWRRQVRARRRQAALRDRRARSRPGAPALVQRLERARHADRRGGGARRGAARAGERRARPRPDRDPRRLFLLGLPAQHQHAGARRLAGDGRHRLPRPGALHARAAHDADREHGPGRHALGRRAELRRHAAHVPEPGRRHLHALGPADDPRRGRGEKQRHLQDPLQRCGRDDRRPAGRGRAEPRTDRATNWWPWKAPRRWCW